MTGTEIWKRIRITWAILGTTATATLLVWSWLAYRPRAEAQQALAPQGGLGIERVDHGWCFTPATPAREVGLLFIPGALVDPVAYAPLVRKAAEAGHVGLLMELPRRGALGGAEGPEVIERALRLMDQHPKVRRWVLAGHSLGGAIASRLARDAPGRYAALALLGTSHPKNFTLADLKVPVLKVWATRDGFATPKRVEATRGNLPTSTRWISIEGGNHSQFGYYGFQPGDSRATISRQAQQVTVQANLLVLLNDSERGLIAKAVTRSPAPSPAAGTTPAPSGGRRSR